MDMIIIFLLLLGSFANNLISFFADKSKLDLWRSRCLCGYRSLSLVELIPVFNYFWTKFECRHCKKKLSIRYPLVEVSTVLFGLPAWSQYGYSSEFFIWFSAFYILMIIALVDFLSFIIPNYLVIVLLIVSLVKTWLFNDNLIIRLIASSIMFITLILVNQFCLRKYDKEVIGNGDIKLIFVLFILMYFITGIISLWISSVIALISFYVFKYSSKKLKYDDRVPFGFFLALGAIFSNLFELEILQTYYSFIGV